MLIHLLKGSTAALAITLSFVLAAFPGVDLYWWLLCIGIWVGVGAILVFTSLDDSSSSFFSREALTPGWPSNVAVALLFVLSCSAISAPGGYFDRLLICSLLWPLVGAVWLVRLVAVLLTSRGRLRDLRWRNWLFQLGLAVLLLVLAFSAAPLWASYLLSRDAMNDYARSVLAGKNPATIHRIGLYQVESVAKIGESVRFSIAGTAGLLEPSSFVYSRNGPSLDFIPYGGRCRHWDDSWYICDTSSD